MPTIRFLPSGKIVSVPAGYRLADAVRAGGFHLSTPCGGKGLCGKCRVRVLAGDIPADAGQQACLSPDLLAAGWRTACTVRDYLDLTLADPERAGDNVVLTDFTAAADCVPGGLACVPLALTAPSAEDVRCDAGRLASALAAAGHDGVRIPSSLFRDLPRILREHDFAVEAVVTDGHLLALRKRGAAAPLLGLAVDLGTTTLACALCSLESGRVLAVSSAANPQARHGDDVISRIDFARRGRAERRELQSLIVAAVEALAEEVLRSAGLAGNPVLLLALGGNTVMNHLLLGVDTSAIALSPFVSCFRSHALFCAGDIGWRAAPAPYVFIVPNIASYVGGDITSGLLAHSVADSAGTILFLDIGTNGEIVLRANSRTYACAAAAGPAFEGARISQGSRAVPGAICGVSRGLDGDLAVRCVADKLPAAGICGTGILDAVAVLRDCGVVDEGGRLLEADEAREAGVPEPVIARLTSGGAAAAIRLDDASGGGSGVRLTQKDIREVQLAKGAIAAGVRVLLGVAGIEAEAVDEVLLAGGFGNFLRPASAVAVGIVPAGIAVEKIRAVGNAALAGTRECLVSAGARCRAEALSAAVTYVELSGRDDFQLAFAEEMLFPEGNA